ncbi:MAG: 16S rRNA (guanine(527)-N(7))-methyltransferase RsmG [Bacteroidota bacterium]
MDASIVFKYFPDLSIAQKDQFNQLYPLYQYWNEKINVISRKDIRQLYERHVLHSLAIAKFVRFRPNANIMDLGTGGGFPGIPLAIYFPEVGFSLVDSIHKKLTIVKEIANTLNLRNVITKHQRVEKVKGTFDFIVSRAVARTKQLYSWTHRKIRKESGNELDNGLILLKGGDLYDELTEFGRSHQVQNLNNYFEETFFTTKKLVYIPVEH